MKDEIAMTNFQNPQESAEAEEWGGAGCAAVPGSDDPRLLDKTICHLRHLHAEAESDATSDLVSDNARALSMEEFNVAAWNYLPWMLDKLAEFRNQAKLGWARHAEKDRAYGDALAVIGTMRTALVRALHAMEANGWHDEGSGCAERNAFVGVEDALNDDAKLVASPDSRALDWLEEQFTKSRFRNSFIIANEIGEPKMLLMDSKLQPGVVHRAKTVRGLLNLAIQHEQDEKTSAEA